MRLWHYKLLPYLPKSQLLAQWRELNSIFKKQDKHILINYVYEYDVQELHFYTDLVLNEFYRRGIKIKNWTNYNDMFTEPSSSIWFNPFKNHHTDEYLLICFWNLREKYIRGQKDFDDETWNKLNDFVIKEMKGGFK